MRDELLSGSYQPGAYRFFELHRPKHRKIAAAPFRDRVVHHALCNLFGETFSSTRSITASPGTKAAELTRATSTP